MVPPAKPFGRLSSFLEFINQIFGEFRESLRGFTKNPRPVKDPWYTGNFDEAYWDIYEGCQAFLESISNCHI